jgi:serpin B
MRRLLLLLLLVVLLPAPTSLAAEPPMTSLAAGSNAFGLDLYRRLRAKPGNLTVSPASIASALTMTWGGAKGKTAEQMKTALHLEGSQAEVLAASGKLAAALQDPSRPVTLRIANRLFGEKTYRFEKAYLEATRAAYGAPLEPVDFRTGAEKARALINGWVEEKTEKRIANLIPPRGVDDQTRLVLVNAIYFLGDWATPFEKESTRDAAFFVKKGESKNVPTMNKGASFRYSDLGGVKAVELPYKGEQTSMLVLLPAEVDGLEALEKSLEGKKLDAIVESLKPQRVLVSLPKFELSPSEPLSLGAELQELGMKDAFDRRSADFTGIANPPSPAERLFIAKVFHKAFVRVDEKGTEAAAATAVVMARAGAALQKLVEFKADHPFLFLIRDNASGLVLFIGRVADPSAS